MRLAVITGALAITLSGHAYADQERDVYRCNRGDIERVIEVTRDDSASPICEVHYDKTSEGGDRARLWYADYDGDYCIEQGKALTEKLIGFGWSCGLTDEGRRSPEPQAEPEPDQND